MVERATAKIEHSTEVEVATYQYDNSKVHKTLMSRLRGEAPFKLNVYIDKEMLQGNTPEKQRARISELIRAGASVYVCQGPGKRGSYHFKCIVVDRRWLLKGSMNVTDKSLQNEEAPETATGPLVAQYLERLSGHRAKGKLWDGKAQLSQF